MAKAKPKLARKRPPKRTITKQQAIRHLIHAAVRMIAAGEDPFAIQLLVQSADKMLIDLAKKRRLKLVFSLEDFLKPEYKTAMFNSIRETSNFFKHADEDHDQTLPVGNNIAKLNIFQLAHCIVNYQGIFGGCTDHMMLLFCVAGRIWPDSFVPTDRRGQFDALPKIDISLANYFSGWWDDPIFKPAFPNLASEKAEDLQDTQPLYDTDIEDIDRE